MAPRTHVLGLLGPKTILYRPFWAILSHRVLVQEISKRNLPPLKGSELWTRVLKAVYDGVLMGLPAHARGP